MEIKSKEISIVDISLLVENPKNNNTHPDDQIDRLAKLIKHTGFRNPLVVSNRSGFVLCGHGRISAAKKAGLKELPVIYQDFDNEAEEYQYMTADNAIHNWSALDIEKINSEIVALGDFDLDLLGIKDFNLELDALPSGEEEKYTRKVESPIYQITGEKPTLDMMLNQEKTNKLISEIESYDLSGEFIVLIKNAAYRHNAFNYKYIAEYYAHATPIEQKLMEDSGMVIVDFEKAIELGFVELTKGVQDAYIEDE